jgi:predicted CopG family antitoxin
MDGVKVTLHEEVYQDLMDLKEEDAYREARSIIEELSKKPNMGIALDDREDLATPQQKPSPF